MRGGRVLWSVAGAIALLALRAAPDAGEHEPASLPDLSGRWAMVQVMPAMAVFPIFGDVELTTIVTALVDVEQTGGTLVLRDAYCFTDVQMNPPVATTRVPEQFMTSLHPVPRSAVLQPCDGGWRFIQPSVTEVRGAVLADPARDPLPTDAADARVIDQDGDGHPGLTVPVTMAGLVTGETYVVQRLRFALDGRLVGADTISGSIEWTSEQHVVAASDMLLLLSYTYRAHPDPTRHVFVMRRVDLDWTCETTRERLPSLLSPTGS
jgi:hypothetical protein